MIDLDDFMTYGPVLDQEITKLYFDKAFIGAGGVDISHGLTAFSDKVGHIAGEIINNAKETTLLVDHSKIGKRTLYSFAELHQVHRIITTINPPDENWQAFLEQWEIEWINCMAESDVGKV